jgi:retinoblastoma-like protein 1
MFFKRVISVTAEKVHDLCEHLKLESSVVEKVWTVMKMQLSSEPQLLVNRQLDQMIMCAIYGVCKV